MSRWQTARTWRYAAAAFLVAHGFAHLVGFEGTWGIGQFEGKANVPPLLSGLASDATTLKVIGLLWLAGLLAFLVAAAGVALRTRWAVDVTGTAAAYSLLISLAWLPDAWAGVAINTVILGILGALIVTGRQPRIASS
jgi:hypothetical protein